MWNVYEVVNGVRKLFAQCWSESMAWIIATENTSVARTARGIRYVYEKA